MIVSILLYAYSRGVFSSREIERRCNEDLSFLSIAQMNCPNFRVLGDFRKDNAAFFLACFKPTVKLAMGLKLASLGRISLDGSKFQADSSKHQAVSYPRLKQKEQALTEEIDALIAQASRCDAEEDHAYQDRTGYEIIYKQRKVIVEPVFGHIKNSGFRRFNVRGKDKTAGEFSSVCATHNFKKIARSIIKGVVCPEFVKLATNPA